VRKPDEAALLLTGTVGAGKTTVAEAVGDLLAERGAPHAVIDLDWLRRSWPAPPGDPFQHGVTVRNLRALAGTFREAGARWLVLAGVVETRAERDDYRAAVGVPLTVCRLQVDLGVVRERLRRRHRADPRESRWFLERAGELDRILRAAAVEDVVADVTGMSAEQAARAVSGVLDGGQLGERTSGAQRSGR